MVNHDAKNQKCHSEKRDWVKRTAKRNAKHNICYHSNTDELQGELKHMDATQMWHSLKARS